MSYLDFLIQDCLREYANDYIPSAIDSSSAQSAQSDTSIDVTFLPEQRLFEMQPMLVSSTTSVIAIPSTIHSAQIDTFADSPFTFPKQNLFFDSMELISPVSPEESIKMSYLDFLIQDCLREYANDYIPSAIDASSAQSIQSAKFIDVLRNEMSSVTPIT
jgi:hypothetical protein